MFKKIPIVLFVLTAFHTAAFCGADLKDIVCIVRPAASEQEKTFFSGYAVQLSREGYLAAGRRMRAVSGGKIYGSGFIVNFSGTNYIITNNHVVANADTADIEFQSESGAQIYKQCAVLSKNADLDLAIISFPEEKKAGINFVLESSVPQNGTDVWSAGFPALADEPIWQLGKGIISNRNVKSPDSFGAELSFVIQHTAQIDPGSSGGPLLVKKAESKAGYNVIGVNTWKAGFREGANYAVPAHNITKFFEDFKREGAAVSDNIAQEQLRAFAAAVKAEGGSYADILPYISKSYIFKAPAESFFDLLNNSSAAAGEAAGKLLREAEVTEAIRIVIADAVWQKRSKNALEFKDYSKDETGSYIECVFTDKGKEIKTQWRKESGNLYLTDYAPLKIKEASSKKFNYEPVSGISLGAAFPLGDTEESVYEFGYSWAYSKYFQWAVGLNYGTLTVPHIKSIYNNGGWIETVSDEKHNYFGQFLSAAVQYPVQFGNFAVVPYVKVPLGLNIYMDLDFDDIPFYTGVYPGVKFALGTGDSGCLYLACEYRSRIRLNTPDVAGYIVEKKNDSFLMFQLGYEFM